MILGTELKVTAVLFSVYVLVCLPLCTALHLCLKLCLFMVPRVDGA